MLSHDAARPLGAITSHASKSSHRLGPRDVAGGPPSRAAAALHQPDSDAAGECSFRSDVRICAFATANTRRCLYLTGELFKLLELLHSQGIPAAPFKGPVLAAAAYGSPTFREAGDLDLLVRQSDICRVKRLLKSHGFSAEFPTTNSQESAYLRSLNGRAETRYLISHVEHHFGRAEGELNLDVHWGLALRELYLQLKPADLWSWLTPQPFAGQRVMGFGPEETLLMLCINGSKDCWERLDRVCDISELLRRHPSLNWQRIFARSAKIGALRMTHLGLHLAGGLLGAELPPEVSERIRTDRIVGKLGRRVQEKLFADSDGIVESASIGRSIFHLMMRERLHDRIGYCLERLEPTVGDRAALRLPMSLEWMHYMTRPMRLAARRIFTTHSVAQGIAYSR